MRRWSVSSQAERVAERPEYDGIKTPIGWYPLVVWTNGRRLLVEGNPPDEEDVDKACSMHDCDAMGCSSFLHALARYDLPDWYAIANPPRLPVRVPKRTDADAPDPTFEQWWDAQRPAQMRSADAYAWAKRAWDAAVAAKESAAAAAGAEVRE
jgi:hypothetical protein